MSDELCDKYNCNPEKKKRRRHEKGEKKRMSTLARNKLIMIT